MGEVVEIYPLSCYYFGSKEPKPDKDETLFERVQRFKANYAEKGMRTCVEGVLLVELFGQPHVLLLQVRNSFLKLPGGRLRPGEADIDGLISCQASSHLLKMALVMIGRWENVLECGGGPILKHYLFHICHPIYKCPRIKMCIRKPHGSLFHIIQECIKLFLVKLPRSRRFIIPKNLKLLAVPLCQIHNNQKVCLTVGNSFLSLHVHRLKKNSH
ncbi:hypothetical protein QJS10_CPB20g00442 [Acorus calamus]|uniref:Pre-mRNA cleavage factor Im 25 kDa subunit n=1 Tax=Acorus calamus TaxID=4465 RepID=A0AAV9C888_ACOCL|nr:hypothetical protein QJS10_CPB20g00442 [Acorus calamus]